MSTQPAGAQAPSVREQNASLVDTAMQVRCPGTALAAAAAAVVLVGESALDWQHAARAFMAASLAYCTWCFSLSVAI